MCRNLASCPTVMPAVLVAGHGGEGCPESQSLRSSEPVEAKAVL